MPTLLRRRGIGFGSNWQSNGKRAALIGKTPYLQGAFQAVHQCFGDSKPQSRSVDVTGFVGLDAVKRFEDLLQMSFFHAKAIIRNVYGEISFSGKHLDFDNPLGLGVVDGVGDKIAIFYMLMR